MQSFRTSIFLSSVICISDCMKEVFEQNKKILENQEKLVAMLQQQQQQPQEHQPLFSRLEEVVQARADTIEDLDAWEDRLQSEENRQATVSVLLTSNSANANVLKN